MRRSVAIIGGGPSAMILAASLDAEKFAVTLYEKNSTLGKKFLVAGKGGFNLTHSEEINLFISRYKPELFLKNAITNFTNNDLQKWLKEIGISTYTGSSKRIFPEKGIKPIEVLNAIVSEIIKKGVTIVAGTKWIGFDSDNSLLLETKNGIVNGSADYVVFALGGASWKITGSDGTWLNYFKQKNIACNPFEASNCAYRIKWPEELLKTARGMAIKNCQFTCGNSFQLGEAVITESGIEGSGVYPLGHEVRKQLSNDNSAEIRVDFKPQNTIADLTTKLLARKKSSVTDYLIKDCNLGKAKTLVLKAMLTKAEFTDIQLLAEKIKNLPLPVTGLAAIDEAISTVGGIDLREVDENYQLKKMPRHFAIGEMLDWDAPTGGYLLQACFSMGNKLANYFNAIL